MRRSIHNIIFILLALIAGKSYGQRSCVFLESPMVSDSNNQQSTIDNRLSYDRPRATLHKIHTLSLPTPQSITNAAPDFPNINVSSYLLADQNETSIAINPTDPKNIIIGANDYRSDTSLFHFQSFDGGLSWSAGSLNCNWTFAANPTDPAVAFNASGKAFYSYGRTAQDTSPINDVVCNTSTNGGTDWKLPVRVILDSTGDHLAATFADKYYITIDNSAGSSFKNRIYVTWVEYDINKKDRIRLSFSTDDGVTWSQPSYLTSSGNFQSPIPAIGIGGQVYVAYENIDPSIHEIRFASSIDGGKTFSADKSVAHYIDLGPFNSEAHPSIKNGLRVNSFPSIAIDRSNLHHGRIYMTWTAMGTDNRHHIYFTLSDDSGNSWSAPNAIENDPSPVKTDKFFPWVAVDDVNGDVGIACYDSRADTSNVLTDLYMFFSNDGGQNFIPERISSASSDVSVSKSGFDPYFFGDYNGIAAHNKIWYPAWTDSRVGYDQDIYTSIVRPYSPSAPRNFVALEDSVTHLPDLHWDYSAATAFSLPLGNCIFRLKRTDGGLSSDIPITVRSYKDFLATKNTDYTYTLQVITSDQDTSIMQRASFSPRAINEPLAPMIISAIALPSKLQISFRVPDKNRAGMQVTNLNKIYYLVNGIVTDSFTISDGSRGKVYTYLFSLLHPDGYYLIQLAASSKRSDGDTTLSVLSDPKWLYVGAPLATYEEDFDQSKNIFTPFAWDTTRAGGKLPGNFLNDSLPDVPYANNTDSWFLLPPVTMSSDAHTIEFAHIALVAPGDSATVEVSTDDGVNFTPYISYDKNSHPSDWENNLATSKPVHEALALKYLIGQDAIIRFRLRAHSSGGDGWFIDSIHFTNALSVSSVDNSRSFRASLSKNPIRIGSPATMKLFSDKEINLTVNLYSMLGSKTETIISNKLVSAGEYELEFSPEKAGCYFYEVIARSGQSEERRYGKYIVVP